MNDYFKKNIAALKAKTPSAYQLKDRLSDKISVPTTHTSNVAVKYETLSLHSAYDPVKEGRKLAQNLSPESVVCLYGFGLGYHVAAILEQIGPKGFLLAIELNPDILSAAMILRDQTGILGDPRFHLIFGDSERAVAVEISRYMKKFRENPDGSDLKVLFHAPSFKCIPEHFENITNALEILLIERRVPAIFGDLEDFNYHLNKDIVASTPGIKSLHGKHRNRPAVLVSAGPSLDDAIPYLKLMRGTALFACVDTALPILLREGIRPDYVFTLDPQDESFNYFRDSLDIPLKLIFTPTANARIVHQRNGEKFVAFKEGHTLFRDSEALMREKGATRSGGSVSCLGLDCLIQFSCNPILLTGQDCAFPGNRVYSCHSNIEEAFLDTVSAINTVALFHLEKSLEHKRVKAPTYGGFEIITNQTLYSYLRNIEQIAEIHPETKIYNLFAHGARIDHVTPVNSIGETLRILKTSATSAT